MVDFYFDDPGKRPVTPGELLKRYIIEPYGISQRILASMLGVSRCTVSDLCRYGPDGMPLRNLTPQMAKKLEKLTQRIDIGWLAVQSELDLWALRCDKKFQAELDDVPILPPLGNRPKS